MKAITAIKKVFLRHLWLIGIAILSIAFLAFTTIPKTKTLRLRIDECSTLSLQGSSNINTFDCLCLNEFPIYEIDISTAVNFRQFQFADAQLNIPVGQFECGNKAIYKDLSKALRADEFPFISVDVREVFQTEKCLLFESCDKWTDLTINATINIAEVCKPVFLDVQAMKLGEDRFRFTSSHTLSMCDFNIDPPRALMGLIKVDPLISINFDLTVEVLSLAE